MRAIAEDTLARAPRPPALVSEMRDIYAWFEDKMGDLLTDGAWSRK